jgi:hypothetical protein
VPFPVEAELHPVVHEALALEALGHAHLPEQVHGALLEHAGAHALLDVLAAAGLEHHRLDPGPVEQLAEHEPGGAGADDPHLCSLGHGHSL